MKGYGLFYYIAEAFRGLRANSLVNLLAVGTISMAMMIVGFFLIVFLNLQTAVNALGDRLEMSVYLKEGLTEHEKDFIQHRIKIEPGVKKVSYLSKAEALEIFKKDLKGQEALIQGLAENPLPDSYEITIDRRYADAERLEAMAGKFSEYRGVEEVSYGKEGARVLSGFYTVIAYGGMALAVLLGVTVVFIISNSVRLALYSRGQEIELMQWIGATRGFIQGPFLVEGMMLSMLGLGARCWCPRGRLLCAASGGFPLPVAAEWSGLSAAFGGSIYDWRRRLAWVGRRAGLGQQVPGVVNAKDERCPRFHVHACCPARAPRGQLFSIQR